ncbi:MAG: cysteine dioxygenase family protein, partial [Acidobacteriia bacterium]|nr:cysteine dioxygenase family protein [Terriglobia bacterium]
PIAVELIEALDKAVQKGDAQAVTSEIQHVLTSFIVSGKLHLSERFHIPQTGSYARRLFHRSPDWGYSMVVMTWGPGQSTVLHDHAGMWCVESVVEGRIKVSRFDLDQQSGDRCHFKSVGTVQAEVGASGHLIPPFEYHRLANAEEDRTAITLHVYGGEMDHCNIYEPCPDGWYIRKSKNLSYTP